MNRYTGPWDRKYKWECVNAYKLYDSHNESKDVARYWCTLNLEEK